ncbi:hypothetical protein Tco_0351769 [Tanacetum coccineum]
MLITCHCSGVPGRASSMSTCPLSHCSSVPGRASGMSTCPLSHCLGVSGRTPRYDDGESVVMVAPTIPVSVDSFEGSFRDTNDIGVDVIHLVPVTPVVFPAATVVMTIAQHGEAMLGIQEHLLKVPIQEELRALRDRVDVAEAESASLRATIRTMGAVETVLRNRMRDERQTRIEIEH